MSAAFFWGLVAGSSLVLGGLAALFLRISTRALGIVMAFGAGVLISAVAFVAEHSRRPAASAARPSSGLFAGSIVFYVGDALLDRMGGADRRLFRGAGRRLPARDRPRDRARRRRSRSCWVSPWSAAAA